MDEGKKKEFERTIETYADSFLKADNPRLIYEIAYSQVSMSHGRPKPAPKEVVLDDDTAAEVLFKLVAMADDPAKLDINNAMKEVYRTLGDPSLPYQQELDAAIHEKLPVIESKLKAAIEQQEIQHRMRTGADVSPKELYRHIASEPEIVSDALYGSKGKELLEFTVNEARISVCHNGNSKDHVKEFMTAFNKNFETIQAAFLDRAKTESAEHDAHHNPHISKEERENIAKHAEAVAFSLSLLETSGLPVAKAVAEKVKERPERFVDYTGDISEKMKSDVAKIIERIYLQDVKDSITDKAYDNVKNDPNACLKAAHFVQADIFASSQDYTGIRDTLNNNEYLTEKKQSAACIKYFDREFFDLLSKTAFGRDSLSEILQYELESGHTLPCGCVVDARKIAVANELHDAIEEKYGTLSPKTFNETFDICIDIIEKSGGSVDIAKVIEEAIEENHKMIENDIGKDITD